MKKIKVNLKSDGILWAGLIFFSIPVLILVVILLQSSLQTGKVIEGNRFNNDLNPEISKSVLETLEERIQGLEGYVSSEVSLEAATVIISVELNSDIDQEGFVQMVGELYTFVDETLPISTYFTSSDSMKMYDLQIDVYNRNADESINLHTILTKNANMLDIHIQDVSTALNPELAEELRAAVEAKNNPVEETSVPTESTESSEE
jgi:hypothetical protein